jgi:hypothetical protein
VGQHRAGIRCPLQRHDGFSNTAPGIDALNHAIGRSNIAIGNRAGFNITGSDNIDIGAEGTAADARTIRIGINGQQTATFVAGISGTSLTGSPVVVSSNGKLGVMVSSARQNPDIRDMGGASAGLMRLRPVTFRYKSDRKRDFAVRPSGGGGRALLPGNWLTYGPDGELQSFRYLEFTALLLNELQKQAKVARELAHRLETKDRQLAAQQRERYPQATGRQYQCSPASASRRLSGRLERQAPRGLRALARKWAKRYSDHLCTLFTCLRPPR